MRMSFCCIHFPIWCLEHFVNLNFSFAPRLSHLLFVLLWDIKEQHKSFIGYAKTVKSPSLSTSTPLLAVVANVYVCLFVCQSGSPQQSTKATQATNQPVATAAAVAAAITANQQPTTQLIANNVEDGWMAVARWLDGWMDGIQRTR